MLEKFKKDGRRLLDSLVQYIKMKSKFSKTWNSSKQPRKQIKFRTNAPNHIKRTFMGCLLDKKLRETFNKKSIEVIKGDEVIVMRGKFAKKKGKIGKVDIKNTRIQIDGLQRTKKGGEKLETWFHPSKVKIITLNEKDLRRFKKTSKKEIKKTKTTEKKPVEEKK